MNERVANSRFRYVDASGLGRSDIDFNDLDVRNNVGDKVGKVDGFIVDAASERPYYVVVESGGWFSADRYLVPISHAAIEHDDIRDADVLRVDLSKDKIRKYPKFDKDEFATLDEAQMRAFESSIGQVCCPTQMLAPDVEWSYDAWDHYKQPEWWGSPSTQRPLGDRRTMTSTRSVPLPSSPRPAEHGERIVAMDSQPAGNRAEPGDVLGIESGGEETHLGDTSEDERRRVRISDRDARKSEKNERG